MVEKVHSNTERVVADNDNNAMVTLDQLRDERLAEMTPDERLASRKREADYLGRLEAATWALVMQKMAGIDWTELARRTGRSGHEMDLFRLGKTEDPPTIADILLIAEVCGVHFLGDIRTELSTKVICTPEFEEQYRDL